MIRFSSKIFALLPPLVLLLARGPWTTSLSLDECISYWISSSNLSTLIQRAFNYQAISPLYFLFLKGSGEIFGWSELAVRTPSVIAYLLTVWLVYELGKHLLDSTAGAVATLAFLSHPAVVQIAFQARPYALALFFYVTSLFFLKAASRTRIVLSALCLLGALYFHYLIIAGAVIHVVILRSQKKNLAMFVSILCLGLVPIVPHLLSLVSRGGAYQIVPIPGLIDLSRVVISLPALVPVLLTGCLLAINVKISSVKPSKSSLLLLCLFAWLSGPVLFLPGRSFFKHLYLSKDIFHGQRWGTQDA